MALRVKFAPQKWVQRSSAARDAYVDGIENPQTDWATATAQASNNWKAGVERAAARGLFAAGVRRAGTLYWQQKSAGVGADRYVEGVGVAMARYAEGFEPYAATLRALTLPPRGPKGDAKNNLRVIAVNDALHKKKIALGQSTGSNAAQRDLLLARGGQ
tara:strand:- start:114 stop:590 length:477 start_codon:yes stop_codon:yes gene_type:complete